MSKSIKTAVRTALGVESVESWATRWGTAVKSLRDGTATVGAMMRDALAMPKAHAVPRLAIIARTITAEGKATASEKPDRARRDFGGSLGRMARREVARFNAASEKAAAPGASFLVFDYASKAGTVAITPATVRKATEAEAAAQKAADKAAATDHEAAHAALVEKGAEALATEVVRLRAALAAMTVRAETAEAALKAATGATGKGRKAAPKAALKAA